MCWIFSSIQIDRSSSSESDIPRSTCPLGGSSWWDLIPSLSEIRMGSPGAAADKGNWTRSQCNIYSGAIICTVAIEILRGWSEEKKVVIIPENSIDHIYHTGRGAKLPRHQTHSHNPNSWPAVTTWHRSNTCITNCNSHYIHLLRALHSTDSHSGQGKGLRVGKLTHPESTTHAELLQPPTCVT